MTSSSVTLTPVGMMSFPVPVLNVAKRTSPGSFQTTTARGSLHSETAEDPGTQPVPSAPSGSLLYASCIQHTEPVRCGLTDHAHPVMSCRMNRKIKVYNGVECG